MGLKKAPAGGNVTPVRQYRLALCARGAQSTKYDDTMQGIPIGISVNGAYPAQTATTTKSSLIVELVEAMLASKPSCIASTAEPTATISINAALN